ncbi:type II toxin-antitoxin system PemK/MazF family toxin [Acidovorax sp. SUPP2522]|uniref:type II toxin-antitoxin system PemK/MazF family toxin n=1 Tax=unclassified Acidovorax TaxID=2684926 RepID=UPI00234B8CB9|nr:MULTISPECIES: type II toxin-antitoxin system PemK/MazF family toxin [unclassified Acidovorax]WCM95742.1 type II toxin-antitoxin system PemK/MazF family toxin [Acidovorax sp. GBBC 1281]GKT20138.1 type II toxin-antitoxin system PemK/MazF family toxin [Acidovorax sp. SUPP2522]
MFIPNRGDIVHLEFDPASGKEMKGKHYALVLSSKEFNRRGLAMVCPISQGAAESARTHGTLVSLMNTGTDTQGTVHCHQLKSLDWKERRFKHKETVPDEVMDEVNARVSAILFD